jgi:hypothetical protein
VREAKRSNGKMDPRAVKQLTRAKMRAMIMEKNEMWEVQKAKIEARKW